MVDIHSGFVRLDASSIDVKLSLRYAGPNNFIGAVVDWYLTDQVLILTEAAWSMLSLVQEDVKNDGYSLVIYDAYRPAKAVRHFVKWASDLNDTSTKDIYYQSLDKSEIILYGYVADSNSSHSRGSTVDVTLIEQGKDIFLDPVLSYRLFDSDGSGSLVPFYDDNTIDTGSSFDLFDVVSHYNNRIVTDEQYSMRMYLQSKMMARGFQPYAEERWHFTLKDEPFPNTYFDFDVEVDNY